jgi:hypothetical protein
MKYIIPQCITTNSDFIALTEASQRDFEAKINYCLEIEKTVNTWIKHPTDTLENLLDELELDGLSILSSGFGDPENCVSTYIFHSSWTFECQKEILNRLVPFEARSLLGKAVPNFNASTNEIVMWLQEWDVAIATTIQTFISAQNFDSAIASKITLDSLILAMLCVTAVSRLNPNI